MAYDIQRLRQQQIFQPQPYEDMSGMGEQYGMGMGGGGMNYTPVPSIRPEEAALPPRSQGPLEQIGQQPATSPTFQEETILPNQIPADPTRTPAGASPLRTSGTTAQEIIDLINKQYTPETIDRDRLRKLMDAAPEREEPSIMRRIVAGGIGIGSKTPIEDMEKVMYALHHRAMDDWKTKAEPFSKTADLEGRANVNERTLAGNVASAAVQIDRTEAQRIRDEGKQAVAEKNAESTRVRSAAYAAKNSGWIVKVAGDRIVAVNPNPPGQMIDLGDSGMMDQRELELLRNTGKVETAKATGEAALNRLEAGGTGIFQRDGKQYRFDPATNSMVEVPGAGGSIQRPGTPGAASRTNTLEDIRQEQARYEDLYTYDKTARKWIRRKTDGKFEMKNRPEVGTGKTFGIWGEGVTEEDVKEWDAVKAKIDPTYKPGSAGIGPTGTTKPVEAKPQGIGPSNTPAAAGTGPGGFTPAGKPKYGPLLPEKFKAKEAAPTAVGSGEVVVRDKKTGKEFAMRKENLKKALDTGLYEQVK